MNPLDRFITDRITASAQTKLDMLTSPYLMSGIQDLLEKLEYVYRSGRQLWVCGNGGSAAEALHIASELNGRFYRDRPGLKAEALGADVSYLTAVSNDYDFEQVFSRMLEAKALEGDVLLGLSTSGRSKNVIRAFRSAKKMNVFSVAITGQGGGELKNVSDLCLEIPSNDTARIQECHQLIGHILSEWLESRIFPEEGA